MKCLKTTVFRSPAAGDEAGYDQAGMRSTRGLLMRLQLFAKHVLRPASKSFTYLLEKEERGFAGDVNPAAEFTLLDGREFLLVMFNRIADNRMFQQVTKRCKDNILIISTAKIRTKDLELLSIDKGTIHFFHGDIVATTALELQNGFHFGNEGLSAEKVLADMLAESRNSMMTK
jgi:hypothetical protein